MCVWHYRISPTHYATLFIYKTVKYNKHRSYLLLQQVHILDDHKTCVSINKYGKDQKLTIKTLLSTPALLNLHVCKNFGHSDIKNFQES